MGLYHSRLFQNISLVLTAALLLLSACNPAAPASNLIQVDIQADGKTTTLQVAPEASVQSALNSAGLTLGELDRIEPALYTQVIPGSTIRVIRVAEKFEIRQEVIPFERQVVQNESIPLDKQVLLQKGKNGLREVTLRRVFEDGVEVSTKPITTKLTIIEEPLPEIVMIGIQAPFAPITLPGRLAYLRDGNAWVMEGSTANRRAVVTSGDLDGRIFSLSANGNWLLFTRRSSKEGEINALWAADISSDESKLVELKAPNVIHFADWYPNSTTKILFSTVEARSAAPGWQANNDLYSLTFSSTGWTTKWTNLLEANSGGIYGWWGTSFFWSPLGNMLAYARPDGIGVVDIKAGTQTTALNIPPYQTKGDWAWTPGLSWGPDGRTIYTVDHVAQAGAASVEESQTFDLVAFSVETGRKAPLASKTGMFAYPLTSPLQNLTTGETAFQVAYLQATFPDQSETSRYRIMMMDRDGSDRRAVFPKEGVIGLTPQKDWGAWSPTPLSESGHYSLAVIYEGNLWIIDSVDGLARQVTGDGLTTRVLWK